MQCPQSHVLKQRAILARIYKLQDAVKLVGEPILYPTNPHEYSQISSIMNILVTGIRFQFTP